MKNIFTERVKDIDNIFIGHRFTDNKNRETIILCAYDGNRACSIDCSACDIEHSPGDYGTHIAECQRGNFKIGSVEN